MADNHSDSQLKCAPAYRTYKNQNLTIWKKKWKGGANYVIDELKILVTVILRFFKQV